MLFTGLIGTCLVLRNGTPTKDYPWPKPHDVHLVEWLGAVNTFVLICSSVTVVLAHWALSHNKVKLSLQLVGATLALGSVFLIIKAVEYRSKFNHDIIPGHIGERLDDPALGQQYVKRVKQQLEQIKENPGHAGLAADSATVAACTKLLDDMNDKEYEENGVKQVKPGLSAPAVGSEVNK